MKNNIQIGKTILGVCIVLSTLNSCKNESHKIDSGIVIADSTATTVQNQDNEVDVSYIEYASEINNLQIELGQLALEKAISKDVKDFAGMLIKDHTQSLEELKTFANKKTMTVPAATTENVSKKYKELKMKSGTDFDKEFVAFMVENHTEVVDKMTEISQKAIDADFKLWASRQLDSYITHRDEAIKLNKKMGGK